MENPRALIGALIFIGLVLGANFIMYAIARGAVRSNKMGFWEMFGRSLKTSTSKKDDSMDELRRRIKDLERDKKEDNRISDK